MSDEKEHDRRVDESEDQTRDRNHNDKATDSDKKEKKEKEEFVRLNFTLPKEMKKDMQDMADDLSKSVSQFIRDAVSLYKDKIYDVKRDIESAILQSGLENIRTKTKPPKPPKPPKFVSISQDEDKERLKKRVEGLIKIHKCLPIDKLAQALEITPTEAETYIYELAGEGIDGSLENGIFRYTNDETKVRKALFDLIEKM